MLAEAEDNTIGNTVVNVEAEALVHTQAVEKATHCWSLSLMKRLRLKTTHSRTLVDTG